MACFDGLFPRAPVHGCPHCHCHACTHARESYRGVAIRCPLFVNISSSQLWTMVHVRLCLPTPMHSMIHLGDSASQQQQATCMLCPSAAYVSRVGGTVIHCTHVVCGSHKGRAFHLWSAHTTSVKENFIILVPNYKSSQKSWRVKIFQI